MKKATLPLFVFALIAKTSFGQTEMGTSPASRPETEIAQPVNKPSVIGLQAGTQGLGLRYQFAINDKWSLRAGIAFLPTLRRSVYEESIEATAKLQANFSNFHLMGTYAPFFDSPWDFAKQFQLVGGVALFMSNEVKGHGSTTKSLNYGEIVIDNHDVGTLDGKIVWNKIAPYAGVNLFQSLPAKGLSLSMDMGTYYIGKPEVTIEGTGYLEDNKKLEKTLQSNLRNYQWFPVFQVSINYRINP